MTPDQIRQQQNALMARLNSMPYGTQAYFSAQRQLGQLNAMAPQAAMNAASVQQSVPAQSNEQFRQEQIGAIRDLTEGRARELADDPRLNQAMDFFGQVVNGSQVPFTKEVQRAQLNQQANGTAQANAAQLQALEAAVVAAGGSLNDPSFLAKKQELNSNRQGQNLDALGRMLSQAQLANFNAQAQGAQSLAGIRSGQNAQINGMNLAGANFRGQEFRDTPTGGGAISSVGGGGNVSATLGGGGSTQRFQGGYLTGAASAGNGLAGRPTVRPATPPAPATVPQNTIAQRPAPMAQPRPVRPSNQTVGGILARPLAPGQF